MHSTTRISLRALIVCLVMLSPLIPIAPGAAQDTAFDPDTFEVSVSEVIGGSMHRLRSRMRAMAAIASSLSRRPDRLP